MGGISGCVPDRRRILDVSEDMVRLQDVPLGTRSVDLGSFILRVLSVLAIPIWSIVDASRSAKRTPRKGGDDGIANSLR